MDNHPIPQDVTGFQFKLIGAMTVKQFVYLAVPAVVAWIIYVAPLLPLYIKIPLIILFAVTALVLAFLPIEGRPADVMFKHFLSALFAANQYIYQKTGQKLAFTTLPAQALKLQKDTVNPQAQRDQIKNRQLQALLQSSQHEDMLDDRETAFMQSVSMLMPHPAPQVIPAQTKTGFHLPQLSLSSLKASFPTTNDAMPPQTILQEKNSKQHPELSQPVLSNFKTVDLGVTPNPAPLHEQTNYTSSIAQSIASPTVSAQATPSPVATMSTSSVPPLQSAMQNSSGMPVQYNPPKQSAPLPDLNQQLGDLQKEKEQMEEELKKLKAIQITPPAPAVPVQVPTQPKPVVAAVPVAPVSISVQPVVTPAQPTIQTPPPVIAAPVAPQQTQPVIQPAPVIKPVEPAPQQAAAQPPHVAKIPKDMAKNMGLPNVPDSPNLITGIVRDPRGNVLPNILVEVKDKEGNPVRAFKTNPLGQFASATPLPNGTFTIIFEDGSDTHRFDTIEIVTKGEILLPISVISHDAREELRKALFN